ncbi:MAG: AAA family ATPase [Chitinispirillia bacterium]|jgi:adenylate kinase family enzyme
MNILITGASGSGTTTLGKYISKELDWNHIDADNYYWLPTNPLYKEKQEPSLRLNLILKEIENSTHNIISGSVMNWGKKLEDSFSLIVFLYVKTEIRLERLRKREKIELGIVDPEFIEWASEYDTGPSYGRSLEKHKIWLEERKCDIIKIEGEMKTEEQSKIVLKCIKK